MMGWLVAQSERLPNVTPCAISLLAHWGFLCFLLLIGRVLAPQCPYTRVNVAVQRYTVKYVHIARFPVCVFPSGVSGIEVHV